MLSLTPNITTPITSTLTTITIISSTLLSPPLRYLYGNHHPAVTSNSTNATPTIPQLCHHRRNPKLHQYHPYVNSTPTITTTVTSNSTNATLTLPLHQLLHSPLPETTWMQPLLYLYSNYHHHFFYPSSLNTLHLYLNINVPPLTPTPPPLPIAQPPPPPNFQIHLSTTKTAATTNKILLTCNCFYFPSSM